MKGAKLFFSFWHNLSLKEYFLIVNKYNGFVTKYIFINKFNFEFHQNLLLPFHYCKTFFDSVSQFGAYNHFVFSRIGQKRHFMYGLSRSNEFSVQMPKQFIFRFRMRYFENYGLLFTRKINRQKNSGKVFRVYKIKWFFGQIRNTIF